ncbi:MAG: hypothetical protein RBS32_05125 [Aliarcobacter sp.]|jgi:hypothetical protein|nr:hypothetical protein [Aliarcobacter sp.]
MKTIFAKYNSERLPKYQIVTKIVEDNDKKRYALKEPLCEEAKEHIESVYKNYKLLKSTYDINLVKPTIVQNGILFEMAEGRSLENILLDSLAQNDETSFQRYINKFLDFVDAMVSKRNVVFEPTEEFKEVFGKWEIDETQDIIKLANIDLIFGNIFIGDADKFTLIDYEWIFDFEIPKSYVIWRSLAIFSTYHSINIDKYIEQTILNNHDRFMKLDNNFSNSVHGMNRKYFLTPEINKIVHFSNFENKKINIDLEFFIQLFIEDGNGISEETSIRFPVLENNEIQKFEFDLSAKKNIKSLRLDPLNDSCVVEIERISLILVDNSEIDLIANISSNVCSHHGKNYFFESFDPQIHFTNIDSEIFTKAIKFLVELKYSHISKDSVHVCVNQILNDKNYFIKQKDQKIESLNEELNQKEQDIENLNEQLNQKEQDIENLNNKVFSFENELISLYTSKSYKVTRPFRSLVRILKKIRNKYV